MGGKLTGFSADEYLCALKKLLPYGPAWEDEQSELMQAVLYLTAKELQRIDTDLARLIDESDPRTASVSLSQWFYEWGIPDDCLKMLEDVSVEQYRSRLIVKIRTLGLTFQELLSVIAQISGIESVTAGRVTPFSVNSTVNDRIYGPNWIHAVLVITASTDGVKYFTADSCVDEHLAQWGNELFECLVRSVAPAHKVIVFQYEE